MGFALDILDSDEFWVLGLGLIFNYQIEPLCGRPSPQAKSRPAVDYQAGVPQYRSLKKKTNLAAQQLSCWGRNVIACSSTLIAGGNDSAYLKIMLSRRPVSERAFTRGPMPERSEAMGNVRASRAEGTAPPKLAFAMLL